MSESKKKGPAPVPLDVPLPELEVSIPLAKPAMVPEAFDIGQPLEKKGNLDAVAADNTPAPDLELAPEMPATPQPQTAPEPSPVAKPRADTRTTSRAIPKMKAIVSDDPYLNGLRPLRQTEFSEATEKYVGSQAVGPMKLMASRAMAPLAPRDLIRVVYQLIFDDEDRIAAAALRAFKDLDDRVLSAVLGETLPPTVLLLLARTLVRRTLHLERVLLNRDTPDDGFVYVANHCEDAAILSIVSGNQERMLREYDIIRGLTNNLATARIDLDRAIDFLVREGVFLEDVPQFTEAFNRLGKAEAMEALKHVEISHTLLTEEEQLLCAQHGLTAEQLLLGGMRDIGSLLEAEELELQSRRRQPLNTYPISVQIKMAMLGDHMCVLEGLHSSNRMVASAAIRNPKVREGDIIKIAKIKSISEEVVRYIANSKDWTKSYKVKHSLIAHPKTPPSMVKRWMPLLRATDLKTLAKSKQVPIHVSRNAKRILLNKR